MANQQLLLLQPVENLGSEGDQVAVKAGFARNFLLPRGIAVPVNRSNRKQVDVLRARAEARKAKELEVAQKLAARIETVKIAFAVQTGPGGKMFGAITAQDVVARLAQEGVTLEKKQVHLYTPVKALGKHSTKIKLHAEISLEFEFEVVSENPIEEVDSEEASKA